MRHTVYNITTKPPTHCHMNTNRDVPNPNNSDESEFIRKRIVPFLINRIEIMNIRIRLLINRIGVCGIRVIPIRNRIHSVNIPYEPNNTRIFERVKNIYVSKPTCYIEIFTFGKS